MDEYKLVKNIIARDDMGVCMSAIECNWINEQILKRTRMITRRVRDMDGTPVIITKMYNAVIGASGAITHWDVATVVRLEKGGIINNYHEKVTMPMVVNRLFPDDGKRITCIVNSYPNVSWDFDALTRKGDTIQIFSK